MLIIVENRLGAKELIKMSWHRMCDVATHRYPIWVYAAMLQPTVYGGYRVTGGKWGQYGIPKELRWAGRKRLSWWKWQN